MKLSNSIPRIIYDHEFDVLSLKFASNSNATATEIGPNIILYLDNDTLDPTTITILDFKEVYPRLDQWTGRLPVKIDFENDVMPYLC